MAPSTRRPGTWPLVVLVVWTLYVWIVRIANALGDDALGAGGKAFSVVLSLSFVAFALAGAVVAARSWHRPLAHGEAVLLRTFVGWTVLVWAVRVPMIVLADHDAAFKLVHAALGLVSIALAALVWRSTTGADRWAPDSLSAATPG